MKWGKLLPEFIKPWGLPLYLKLVHRPRPRAELHDYWRAPRDGANQPQGYLEGEEKSQLLLDLIGHQVGPETRILEIGCNVGRNLNYLFTAGYQQLEGIEISEPALALLKESYPEMAQQVKLHNSPVENVIREFADGHFDLVFTMAVLEHIHRDSEWLFPEMERICRGYIITIEDEAGLSWRHFPRRYRRIFTRLGMKQLVQVDCRNVPGLGKNYYARVFRKYRST